MSSPAFAPAHHRLEKERDVSSWLPQWTTAILKGELNREDQRGGPMEMKWHFTASEHPDKNGWKVIQTLSIRPRGSSESPETSTIELEFREQKGDWSVRVQKDGTEVRNRNLAIKTMDDMFSFSVRQLQLSELRQASDNKK